MSSTSISAGDLSTDLAVYEERPWREAERPPREAERPLREAAARPTAAVPAREKRRPGRGRLARALILSLAVVTLVGCGSLVAAAVMASGSARPTDWRQVNWNLVSGRYQACRQDQPSRGLLGCLTAIGPRAGQSAQPRQRGVVYVTAPVQATAPAASAAGSSAASGSATRSVAGPTTPTNQGAAVSAPTAAPAPPPPAAGGDDGGGSNRGPGGGGGDDGGGGGDG